MESGPVTHITTTPFTDERVEITRSDNHVTALVKGVNVRIVMDWHNDFMNYEVCLPRYLCEQSIGHVGSCDGDGDNDVPLIEPRKLL